VQAAPAFANLNLRVVDVSEDLAQVTHVEPSDHVVPWMQTDF
jgi:hypothetical protein